jgi:hypothetical protein
VRRVARVPDPVTAAHARLKKGVESVMFLPDEGSLLLYWTQCSLRRSLRRVRSSARLYQALADRERDEASHELYRLLAEHQRGRAARKLTSLFSLRVPLPVNKDPFAARVWRRLLMLCGPRVAIGWIEWRETRELTVIILVARAIMRLARLRSRHVPRPTS